MKKQKWILSLAFVFFLSACAGNTSSSSASSAIPVSSSTTSSSATITPASSSFDVRSGASATMAEALVNEAKREGISTSKEAILLKAGYHGDEALSKTAFFLLLEATFEGNMPEASGIRKYCGAPSYTYSGLSEKEGKAVAFLNSYGLLTPEVDAAGQTISAFNGTEEASASLIKTYLDRFHAYLAASPVDDFYTSVNADYLFHNPMFDTDTTTFDNTNLISTAAINTWFKERYGSFAESATRTQMAAYLSTYEDGARKVAGDCDGLFPVYRAIADVKSYADLFALSVSTYKTQGYDFLFSGAESNYNLLLNKSLYLTLSTWSSNETSASFCSGSDTFKKEESRVTSLFTDVGFSSDEASSFGHAAAETEAFILALKPQILAQQGGEAKYPLVKPVAPIGAQYFDLPKHFADLGITLGEISFPSGGTTYTLYPLVLDTNVSVYAYFTAMQEGYLEGFKALSILNEMSHFAPCNPTAVFQSIQNTTSGDPLHKSGVYHDYAVSPLAYDFMRLYHGSADYEANKQLCTQAISELKAAFDSRIEQESWLSNAGKTSCHAKIKKMRLMSLFDNDDGTNLALPETAYAADSLYANLCRYNLAVKSLDTPYLDGRNLTIDEWENLIPCFTANAFYAPGMNVVSILMGYLAAQGGFTSLKQEQLYAQLYMACGHEISHGFDSNGVNYDENGTSTASWWSEDDLKLYRERSQSVVLLYTGYEVYPGLANNGTTTLSEAGADVAGMRLTLDLVAKKSGFDYDAFFHACAKTYGMFTTRNYYTRFYQVDVHPFGRARINPLFASMDEFVSTYALRPGQGMYVEESKRAKVW